MKIPCFVFKILYFFKIFILKIKNKIFHIIFFFFLQKIFKSVIKCNDDEIGNFNEFKLNYIRYLVSLKSFQVL
jgi:hypothetical protein